MNTCSILVPQDTYIHRYNPVNLKSQPLPYEVLTSLLSRQNLTIGLPKIFPFLGAGSACFEFKYSITFGRLLRCSATLFLAFIIPESAAYSSTNLKQQFFYK